MLQVANTSGGAVVAAYVYDADGGRVKKKQPTYTRIFVGDHYEVEGSTVKQYYSFGGVRLAESVNGTLYFLLSDRLGSTAITTQRTGGSVAELRYRPFGIFRYNTTGQVTSYRFTGQRWDSGTGLYWYRSRWYDPEIGRFIQPDTIAPERGNPQRLSLQLCSEQPL